MRGWVCCEEAESDPACCEAERAHNPGDMLAPDRNDLTDQAALDEYEYKARAHEDEAESDSGVAKLGLD